MSMIQTNYRFTTTVIVCSIISCLHARCSDSATVAGVFEGTSPCAAIAKPLLKIPTDQPCDRIKWTLTLYNSTQTGKPAGFRLTGAYGYHVDNRTFKPMGSHTTGGTWKIIKGTRANAEATAYQLNPDKPALSISFLKLDDNLLHLLDRDKSLMVGNGGQSYTLSRTDAGYGIRDSGYGSIIPTQNPPAIRISHPASHNDSLFGVFVGRSPCREIVRELNISTDTDCMKLKWKLTLYKDPVTNAPTTYKLERTLHRQSVIEGRWAIMSSRANPKTIIYQLQPNESQSSLYLLKGDDNVLFFLDKSGRLLKGNVEFSYTLNRTGAED